MALKIEELRSEILKDIDGQGYIGTSPRCDDKFFEAIDSLEEDGTIETLTKAGVVFLNSGWSYVRTGNPQNVRIVTDEHHCSWPEPAKPLKKKRGKT